MTWPETLIEFASDTRILQHVVPDIMPDIVPDIDIRNWYRRSSRYSLQCRRTISWYRDYDIGVYFVTTI
jgi:hypothetical protein